MEHSKDFPPSAAKQWLDCFSYLPGMGDNYASKLGTLCHDAAEEWIKKDEKPFAVPPEIKALIQDYVDYCMESKPFADEFLIEEKLEIACTGSFGTSDFAQYWSDRSHTTLEVCDLKTGVSIVSPNSEQLRLYALGAVDYFELRKVKNLKIKLRVFQRGKDKTHVLKASELFKFEKEVIKAAEKRRIALKEVKGHTTKGNSCYWCARKPECPEWVLSTDEFEDLTE